MRKANIKLTYNGRDISFDLAPFVEGFSYTDNDSGQADDLQITLNDQDQRWKNDWYPEKGASLTATIICEEEGVKHELECGIFEIDEVEPSGPPSVVTIKAVSTATSKSMRREKKTRGWEATTLQNVAGALAQENGIFLYYQAEEIPFDRVDQREESDLQFLKRLADDWGVGLKVAKEKLIIYSGREFESKPASFTVKRGERDLIHYQFKDQAHNIYNSCQVSYRDPELKEDKIYIFTPPNPPATGQILRVNKRVETLAAAMNMAKARLRKENRGEVSATFDLVGHVGMVAGLNIMAQDFGVLDGKYFIKKATHEYGPGSGYETSIETHRVLDY